MKLLIIGKGNHSGVVADALNKCGITNSLIFIDESFPIRPNASQPAFIAIGDNRVRERISKYGFDFINVAHPLASTWKSDCIGTYFGANSVVGNNSKVGDFCIINTGVILEHDSVVGDYTHLAPGVVTGGRVKIGSRTFIGLGAIIRDGITIGNDCTVGMGSVITKDLPDNCTAYGNPARIIERKLQTMEWKK